MKKHMRCLLPDRPIAFNRDLVTIGCGVKGALMLSQAIYWSKRTKTEDRSFYKTQAEWEEETGLTRHEQAGAQKLLQKLGYLSVKKRGMPARNYYIVQEEAIIESLLKIGNQSAEKRLTSEPKSGSQVSRKADDILYTESTTESTTDIVIHTKEKNDIIDEKTQRFIQEVRDELKGVQINQKQVAEIQNFVSYWTEPDKNWEKQKNPKIRYDHEDTWDMKRRIGTWMRNSIKWENTNKRNIGRNYDEDES